MRTTTTKMIRRGRDGEYEDNDECGNYDEDNEGDNEDYENNDEDKTTSTATPTRITTKTTSWTSYVVRHLRSGSILDQFLRPPKESNRRR